jgi:hypothetical protein
MAATISINFATPEEVFSIEPPTKKSISAKVLNDVLGGGVVGGGYVQRNGGTPMSNFLTLFSGAPIQEYHAAHKQYVDEHAYTRRYYYSFGAALSANQMVIYGPDDYGQNLYFFDDTDVTSIDVIQRYVDVYRNGILQVYGQDFYFSNLYQVQQGILGVIFPHKVHFNSPLLSGTNVQIHVGNKGAMPAIVGVATLSGRPGSGIRINNYYGNNVNTGDLSISAYPLDFIATTSQVRTPNRNDLVLSPMNLSAFPLMPKAFGMYRRFSGYERTSYDSPYGSPEGFFHFVKGFNLGALRSGGGTNTPETLTCFISSGVFPNQSPPGNYSPFVNVSVASGSSLTSEHCTGVVFNNTKLAGSFQFGVFDFTYNAPEQIDEISITVY